MLSYRLLGFLGFLGFFTAGRLETLPDSVLCCDQPTSHHTCGSAGSFRFSLYRLSLLAVRNPPFSPISAAAAASSPGAHQDTSGTCGPRLRTSDSNAWGKKGMNSRKSRARYVKCRASTQGN
eukprot:GHUV01047967.1.p1 GENE.GHUV01047967.1~~GHUV01047967.1.p1  ORF type:complete len:122 (+),score=7.93 GHUV01047967.1:235-600(+)